MVLQVNRRGTASLAKGNARHISWNISCGSSSITHRPDAGGEDFADVSVVDSGSLTVSSDGSACRERLLDFGSS